MVPICRLTPAWLKVRIVATVAIYTELSTNGFSLFELLTRPQYKRVATQPISNQTGSGQTNNSSTTSQSNSQSDSPTPPAAANDSLLCMNGNREFVGRLVH